MTVRLTLFVAGTGAASRLAASAVRGWCETNLGGDYRLDVCDVRNWPQTTENIPVLAVPALRLEAPPAVVVGDLSDIPRAMAALGLAARAA